MLQIVDATYLTADVIIARMLSQVQVPHGPLKGTLETLGSLVSHRTGTNWEMALFHNTRVADES